MNPAAAKGGIVPGDILQLSPFTTRNKMFGGCLFVATEIKVWGVQGYVQTLGAYGMIGGQAHYRAQWDELEYTGGSIVFDILEKPTP